MFRRIARSTAKRQYLKSLAGGARIQPVRQRSMVSALRILQIRLLAKFLEVWGRTEAGRNAIVWLRGGKYRTRVLASLVGYRQTFPSFEAAAKYAGHFQF